MQAINSFFIPLLQIVLVQGAAHRAPMMPNLAALCLAQTVPPTHSRATSNAHSKSIQGET
jgi:hypothetical protein